MLEPGDQIGAYEVVARLREGGMATLFLGKRTGASGFETPVAIKVVHPHLADETLTAMLIDEARIAVQVRHPNVVRIEDLGEHEGQPFIAMEYVPGLSVAQLLSALAEAGLTMKPELAAHLALHVAAALHAAHEARDTAGNPLELVHRDVSPQNVLVSTDGHVKVIDFGVAKARGRAVRTSGGALKGKFAYMSPEQALARAVDRRTDVYALGILLWEMITGRRRFRAKHEVDLLMLVRDPDVVSPRSVNPACPAALDAVVLHALAKEPDARPATAAALRLDLLRAVPEAAALDPASIAALVTAMSQDLRATLPPPATAILDARDPERGADAVAQLTVRAKR